MKSDMKVRRNWRNSHCQILYDSIDGEVFCSTSTSLEVEMWSNSICLEEWRQWKYIEKLERACRDLGVVNVVRNDYDVQLKALKSHREFVDLKRKFVEVKILIRMRP